MHPVGVARGLGRRLAMLGALVAAAVVAVYAISQWKLHRLHDAPLTPLRPGVSPDLVEGERMARISGCWDGCHGPSGEGGRDQISGIFRNTAPTLSQVLPQYSDQELARLIRYGVKRDGKSAVGMNSFSFWALGDQDLANVIAHLRRQPALAPVERTLRISWRGRLALVTGRWMVAADQVDRARPRWGELPRTTPIERGRYLASVTCSECHGLDFGGNPLERAPSLAVLAAYSMQQFMHLMRTAQPVGGRRLDRNMDWVAKAPFTDEDIRDLYLFLRSHHGLGP